MPTTTTQGVPVTKPGTTTTTLAGLGGPELPRTGGGDDLTTILAGGLVLLLMGVGLLLVSEKQAAAD